PAQNGVAKRKNHHLLEVARALLFQMTIPKPFWVDAVSTTCFLINRMPSVVLGGNYPYSVLFPTKPLFPIDPKIFGKENDDLLVYVSPNPIETTKQSTELNSLPFKVYARRPRIRSDLVHKPSTQLKDVPIDAPNDAPNDVSNDEPNEVSNDVPISAPTKACGKSDAPSDVPSGSDSPPPSPTPKLDLPIALRKGKHTCRYLVSAFVSYDGLSTSARAFVVNLDSILVLKIVGEALAHSGWRAAVIKEMNALDHNRYLKGTPGLGILYANHGHHIGEGFTDADYTGCPNTSRPTTGYCVFVRGNLVSWKSKKQNVMSRLISEAEYRAMAQMTCELVWLRNLLGDDVIEILSEKVKGLGDWNSPEYQDTTGSKGKKVTKALSFYKMETDEVSERYSTPCFVNGLEAYTGESNLAFDENLISNEYAMKLCLDYKVKKRKKLVKKELIVSLKGELYFVIFIINPEEDDVEPGVILGRSFMRLAKGIIDFNNGVITIYPESDPFEDDYEKTFEGKVNGNALADTGSDINIMPYRIYETLVGVTTIIAKFIILDIPIDRDPPIVVGRGFMYTIGSILNTKKLFLTSDGIFHQTFRATIFDVLRTTESDSDDEEEYQIKKNKFGESIYELKPAPYLNCNDPANRSFALEAVTNPFQKISVWKKETMRTHDDEAGSSRFKRSRQHETVEEVLFPQVHHEFLLWEGCVKLDLMRRFTSVAWIRAFNINEPIYTELCHDFYSTYEFDDVCADDEMQTTKIIKFRLGGRAHSLTFLEFARRLGLYQATELDEEGFNVYFEGGLRSDEHFNAREYWLSISREENLSLSKSHASTIKYLVLRVIHNKITYGLRQRTTGLIPEDQQPGVPRVGIPRPPRASMQDLYDRMAGVYSVSLRGAYNPPGYAQPQYDQYYQQYPHPPPPQYHQQQQLDNNE
nr:polyprotein, putative [Tanacetum cinerariifolium]